MSKRFLSLLLTLALCFSMLPTAALAETADAAAEETQNVENDADVYTVGEDAVVQSGEEGGIAVQASGHTDHALCQHTGECSCPEDAKSNAFTNAKPLTSGVNTKDGDLNYLYIGNKEAKVDFNSGFRYFELSEGNYYLADNLTLPYAIQIPEKAKVNLCLNGYSITKTTDTVSPGFEGVITLYKGATFSLCDCKNSGKITHESGKIGRGVKGGNSGVTTFNMYGGEISGNKAGISGDGQDGAGVYMQNGTFNMYGGKITDNHVNVQLNCGGGGVYVYSGTFTMSGGEISGNTSPKDGGGVFMQSGTFTMSGGTVTGNTATGNGGGVYYWTSSTSSNSVTVSGSAKIEKNKAVNGGGIYVTEKGKLTMTGGTVTENKAENGGGVWTANTFTVSGAPKIIDNTDSTGNTKNNVYLSTASITIGQDGMDASANIGVTTGHEDSIGSGEYVTVGIGANNGYHEGNIFSDKGGDYVIKADGDEVRLYNGLPHRHPVCGTTGCEESGHNDEEFKKLTTSSLGEKTLNKTGIQYYYRDLPEGNWYLTGDFKPDATLRITGKVNLCLNGHSIIPTAGDCVIRIDDNDDAGLTLCDCSNAQTGKITTNLNGRGVSVTKGRFTMYGGSIADNGSETSGYNGAGVFVDENTTFTMYGGEIRGNKANTNDGGGIYTLGTFNLISGTVTGNSARNGGGIYNTGTFTMSGGSIGSDSKADANTATANGGGVYMNSGKFTMNNGTIFGNSVTNSGGGIFVNTGRFTMENGTISGNNAANGGGVLVDIGSAFYMNNGTISGNKSTENGGGVVVSGGTFTMNDGNIADNTAKNGGGVYADSGVFEMTGGIVGSFVADQVVYSGNTAKNGGGVYVGMYCTFKMGGSNTTPLIYGNNVADETGKGAGVYADGTFRLSGAAQITDNNYHGTNSDVYLPDGKTISITDKLIAAKMIGITPENMPSNGKYVTFAKGSNGYTLTDGDAGAFFPDDDYNNVTYNVRRKDNELWIVSGELHEHPICGDKNCEDGHKSAFFSALNTDALSKTAEGYYELSGGNWYLTENLSLDATLRITGNVNLCLNGHSITATADTDAIELANGSALTLCDCSSGGIITHSEGKTGRGVCVTNGSFTMYGGAIAGNTLSGSDVKGAGVYVANGSSFTMTGGTVSRNTVSGSNVKGAGICNNGTTTIGGSAVISENTLANTGSGTVLQSKDGGGIYTSGTLIVEGNAKIINNQSPIVRNTHGGGIYVSNGTVELRENAVVTGNQVGSYGAGICMYSGKLTVSDSVQVTGNEQVYDSNYKDTGNVYICDTYSMPIGVNGELTDKACIGVRLDSTGVLSKVTLPVTVASATAENRIKEGNFVSDENKYAITVTDGGTKAVFSEHQHTWEYAASGATITAKCSVCKTGGGSVTITAPDESSLTYDGTGKGATLNSRITTGEALPAISYIKTGKYGPERLESGALPTGAGDYQASITLGDATAEVTYTIKKALPTADDFLFTPSQNMIYDGTPKTAAVSSDKIGMGEATVKYYDKDGKEAVPENAGTYTVKITVTEGANYAAAPELTADGWTFTVMPNAAVPTVGMSGDTTYTGKQIKPEVSVKVGNTVLTEGTDYTVTYGENKNVGTGGTVTVTAMGNYGFTDVNENFSVTPRSVTVSGITAADKIYDGTAEVALDYSKAAVEGKAEGDELTVSADGVFAAADADRESAVVVNLSLTLGGKDKDNYVIDSTYSQSETYAKILPAVLTVTPNAGQGKTYNTADPELTYTYSGAANGETPAFTGAPARAEGENTGEYTINLGTLKLADGSGFKSNNYDLKLADTVVKFTINKAVYGDKTAPGSAMYGNDGTVDLRGLIAEGGTAALGTVTDTDGVLTGAPSVSGTALKFSFADDASKFGKTATVVVKVTGAVNYEDYIITVTLTAENKLTPVLDGDVTLSPAEITYGELLSKIIISGTMKVGGTTVEGEFAWQNPDEIPEAGAYWGNWKFTPNDKKTYTEATGSAQVTVKNAKQSAKLNMTGYTYGETPVKPYLTERNTDTEVTYYYNSSGGGTDNIWDIDNPPKLNAGTYNMRAVISGTKNYNSFITDPVEFKVEKAMPNFTKPSGLTAKYTQKLGDITLTNPDGNIPGTWSWQKPDTVLDSIGVQSCYADFKPSEANNYLEVTGVEIDVNVGKADGSNLKTVELSQKYTDASAYTYTPDWSGLPDRQSWTYNSEYSVSAGSTAKLTTHDFAADGSLLTYAVSGGKAGDVVTVTLKASCSNYEDFTVTLNITLADRDEQAALLVTGDNTVVYGQTLTFGSDGGSGTGEVTYAVTSGTGDAAIDPKTGILTPVKVGTVTVTATKAGDNNFKEVTSAPFEITITQAASEGEPNYTKLTRSGKTLNDAALTTDGSTLNPNAGTLEWLDDEGNILPNDTKVEANKTYKWRFMPDDGNYAVLTGEVELYHVSSGGGGRTTRYTVKFETNGAGNVSTQTVIKNSVAKEPAEPKKDGYIFDGWYLSNDFAEKYDFKSKVTKNLTLYAKWTEDKAPADDKDDNNTPGDNDGEDNPTDNDKHDCPSMNFDDLDINQWYHLDTDYVLSNGLMNGTDTKIFAPNENLTRAMLVTVLYRNEGEPAVDESGPFIDVEENAYFKNAVSWAHKNGIVKGISETEFAPDINITREQIAVMIYRYAQFKGIDVSDAASADITAYGDFASISNYAAEPVRWAVGSGLINGRDESSLSPKENATRAEIAAILHRFIEGNK